MERKYRDDPVKICRMKYREAWSLRPNEGAMARQKEQPGLEGSCGSEEML